MTSRRKLVAFRLRAKEYEALHAIAGEGSCSVSEFARTAIFHRVSSLRQIRSRLAAVARELQKLTAEVRALRADAANIPATKKLGNTGSGE
jgi:hypothetical protein